MELKKRRPLSLLQRRNNSNASFPNSVRQNVRSNPFFVSDAKLTNALIGISVMWHPWILRGSLERWALGILSLSVAAAGEHARIHQMAGLHALQGWQACRCVRVCCYSSHQYHCRHHWIFQRPTPRNPLAEEGVVAVLERPRIHATWVHAGVAVILWMQALPSKIWRGARRAGGPKFRHLLELQWYFASELNYTYNYIYNDIIRIKLITILDYKLYI